MERIDSRRNAVVKRFRALAREGPGPGGEVLLDGEHLLAEALAAGVAVDVAAFSRKYLDAPHGSTAALAGRARTTGARVLSASEEVFTALSPVRQPGGVAAIARMHPAGVASLFRDPGAPALVLVIAGVQDPGNVGAIIRSAAAFGATGVVATGGTASPFGWKALRGAMGGTFRIPVASDVPIADVIAEARAANLDIVAAVPSGGTRLPDMRFKKGCVVAVGGEGAGVPPELASAAGASVTIPMRGPVESLNVATAAALILYEASRQRSEHC